MTFSTLLIFGCQTYSDYKVVMVDGANYPQTSTGINAAVQNAGSESNIVLLPGSYSLTGPIVIDGLHNITIHIKSGAKLLANPEDFNSSVSMLVIARSDFVAIIGEKGSEFNGFGTPRDCVAINASSVLDAGSVSHVQVSGLDCTGTRDGIDVGESGNLQANTMHIEVDHNVVSDTTGVGQINVQATVDAAVHDNVLNTPRAGQNQIICENSVDCHVYDNALNGFVPLEDGSSEAAIKGHFC